MGEGVDGEGLEYGKFRGLFARAMGDDTVTLKRSEYIDLLREGADLELLVWAMGRGLQKHGEVPMLTHVRGSWVFLDEDGSGQWMGNTDLPIIAGEMMRKKMVASKDAIETQEAES